MTVSGNIDALEAGAPEDEKELARAVYDALRAGCVHAHMSSFEDADCMTIDGSFNLFAVAESLKVALLELVPERV